MRYLMLLTNPTEAVERWRAPDPEEAKAEREQELPKWGAFMQWAEEQGIDARRARARLTPTPRKRSAARTAKPS